MERIGLILADVAVVYFTRRAVQQKVTLGVLLGLLVLQELLPAQLVLL